MFTAPRFNEFIKYASTLPPYSELQGLYPEYTLDDGQLLRTVEPGGGLLCRTLKLAHGYDIFVYNMRGGITLVNHIRG